jgi:hypothetical protein
LLEADLGEVALQVDAPCHRRQPIVRGVRRLPARQGDPCPAGDLKAVPTASAAEIDQEFSRRQVQRCLYLG